MLDATFGAGTAQVVIDSVITRQLYTLAIQTIGFSGSLIRISSDAFHESLKKIRKT